jgi:histidyl-tRNA synthetase
MSQKLSNEPYKGCPDYLPQDFQKLQYIFSKFREVSLKYGFKEYLTPVLERTEIYEAKSGEDIKKELFTLEDSGGRRLALRPEMTPSVTRLVTRIYGQEPKPIRYFSIANFFRGERPQKGRDREFWQLNADVFGENSIFADLEVLQMAIDIMLAFSPPKNSFVLKLNNRKLIDYLFDSILNIEDKALKTEVTRKMDKYNKLSREEFETVLDVLGLSKEQVKNVVFWMTMDFDQLEHQFPDISESEGFQEVRFLMNQLVKIGYGEYVTYAADMIRGFDYYDGTVFEMFDLDPSFSRSVFGGGRYNGLADIFGSQPIPAVGFAPGNVPVSIFLDNWKLWPNFREDENIYYLPLLQDENSDKVYALARKLRNEGFEIEMSTSVTTISKALAYANKKDIKNVVIYGTQEMKFGSYKLKNMKSGEEEICELS